MSRWPRAALAGTVLTDLALVVAVAAVQLVGTVWTEGPDARPLDWLGLSLLVAAAAPLAARSVWPRWALGATAALAFGYNVFDYPSAAWTVSLVIGLYTAVAAGDRMGSLAIVTVAFAAYLATGTFLGVGHFIDGRGTPWFVGWLTVGFVAGEVRRARRAYLEEVERRAAEAERSREEQARRRASEERMRIARELHDVLAHSISQINVQAGVALHLLDRQPEGARPALIAITQASRDALRELRSTLDVLRGADGEDPRAPAPSLSRIQELVDGSKAAGIDVQLRVTGDERPLPAAVDLAAYRIVQESLTNVARHARPAAATVLIDYGAADLVIEVDDEGRTAAPPVGIAAGHGLIGMRERAASVAGRLEVGPRAGGGFRVRASLPIAGAA